MCETKKMKDIINDVKSDDPDNLIKLFDDNKISKRVLIKKIEKLEYDSFLEDFKFFLLSISTFLSYAIRSMIGK